MNVIKLLLVDDQPALRRGLGMRLALEPDMQVIGEAADGEEALKLIKMLAPDVVLMDVEMPRMDGIAATKALHATVTSAVVVMLSIHDDVITRARAQKAGAVAFLGKNGSTETLVAAIRQAAQQIL